MAKIYYRVIKNSKDNGFTIDNVPALWRKAVEKLIAENGI